MNLLMKNAANCLTQRAGWLDRIAIIMAVVCGIHCLITPILLVALPILATTFWSSSNFHLWMLCFVLPTTALASILGYRRHKNKGVTAFAIAGVALLATATLWERASLPESYSGTVHASESPQAGIYYWDIQQPKLVVHKPESPLAAGESCGSCCPVPSEGEDSPSLSLAGITLSTPILLNLLGGLLLIRGHWRNFKLCRTDHSCTR